MMEKKEKKLGIWCVEVRHGRATIGTGRAKLLDFCGLEGMVRHGRATEGTGRATAGTGRAKVLAVLAQFFFSSFSGIVLGQLPTKQIKTNKEQTKSD